MHVMQIAAALPTPALVDVLSKVPPVPDMDGHIIVKCEPDYFPNIPEEDQILLHLLLLLPPRCHPAVLCARCPSLSLHRTLSIPKLPAAAEAVAMHALAAAAVCAEGRGGAWRGCC